MGFWGMSSTGKDAQRQLQANAGAQQDRSNWWNDQSRANWSNANDDLNWSRAYWGDRVTQGLGTPEQLRNYGQKIINIDDPMAAMWSRAAKTQSMWEQAPKAQETMDKINSTLDQQGGAIGQNWDAIQNLVDESARNRSGRVTDTSGRILDNLDGSFSKAGTDWGNAYDAMSGRVTGNRKDNLSAIDTAYTDVGSNLDKLGTQVEKLRPGGEFQVAQTARSFAPMVAAQEGRLRRMGVDPNGVQGASIIGDAEAARARGMDDAAARGTSQYVDAYGQLVNAKNNAATGRAGATVDANNYATSNLTALDSARASGNRDMTLSQGLEQRNQMRSDTADLNAIDSTKTSASIANQQSAYQDAQALLAARAQAAREGRQMTLDDVNNFRQLMADQNGLDMTGLNLAMQQYQLGKDYQTSNLGMQDQAAGQIGQISAANRSAAFGAAGEADSNLNSANNLWNNIYSREAANAGWGTKMLLGSGLGFATGGLSNILGGGGFFSPKTAAKTSSPAVRYV